MKIIILTFSILMIGCFQKKDQAMSDTFSKVEFQEVNEFIVFFEKKTMPDCKGDLNKCYKSFFKNRVNSTNMGFSRNDIDIEIKEVERVLGSSFEQVFEKVSKTFNPKSQNSDKKVFTVSALLPNYNGKYKKLVEFLYKNTRNTFLKEYCGQILSKDFFGIIASDLLLRRYGELDFRNLSTRLIVIIHLLSLDYNYHL